MQIAYCQVAYCFMPLLEFELHICAAFFSGFWGNLMDFLVNLTSFFRYAESDIKLKITSAEALARGVVFGSRAAAKEASQLHFRGSRRIKAAFATARGLQRAS